MNDWHPLVRAWVVHGPFSGVLDLQSSVDPSRPLAPGQEFRIAMTVTPSGGAYRTYGYLMDEGLRDTVVLDELQGMRRLDNGRYAAFAPGTETVTATALVRVKPGTPEGSVILPRVIIGVMPAQGERLVYSSGIEGQGYYVRHHELTGLVLRLRPGQQVTLPPPHGALRVTGVTLARVGVLNCAPDGSVTYQAHPTHLGYDRFSRRYEDEAGHTAWSDVTIHVGDLGISPGAIPVHA